MEMRMQFTITPLKSNINPLIEICEAKIEKNK